MAANYQRGGILWVLLFLIFLLAAIGFGWYWYQGNPDVVTKWFKGHVRENRSYVTYEEYLNKKQREKTFATWKTKIQKIFNRSEK